MDEEGGRVGIGAAHGMTGWGRLSRTELALCGPRPTDRVGIVFAGYCTGGVPRPVRLEGGVDDGVIVEMIEESPPYKLGT